MGIRIEESIEQIILARDRRGIGALRRHLPSDFCTQAAKLAVSNPGNVLIVTGFYSIDGSQPETDGPLGSIALGEGLRSLNSKPYYVTDEFTAPLLRQLVGAGQPVVTFPITDEASSRVFAQDLLARLKPSLVIAVERCGLTALGTYLNLHGADLSAYNAKIDYLFDSAANTIGIGDGGNEIGMGNLADVIPETPGLPAAPCITPTKCLVIAGVSNWGAYGLLAAMSLVTRRNLLPSIAAERSLLMQAVAAGAVDGTTGEHANKVDGFSLDENSEVLTHLHQFVADCGLPANP